MIPTLPAVQKNTQRISRYVCIRGETLRWFKKNANRRHRRMLNAAVRRMTHDPERWWDEGFNAYSLSAWELW